MADANVPRGRMWSNDELELLIDIWGSAEILSKMDGTSRNASVFKEIVTTLSNAGYERTAKEVKNKIKNLKRDYKKVVDHNKRSGVEAKEIMFQDKLDLILGDRPLAQPVAVAQSGRRSNVRSMTEKDDDRSSLDRSVGQDTNENATMTIEDGEEWSDSEVNSTASSISTPSCESPPARVEINNGQEDQAPEIERNESPLPAPSTSNRRTSAMPGQENQALVTESNESHIAAPDAPSTSNRRKSIMPDPRTSGHIAKKTKVKETLSAVEESFGQTLKNAEKTFFQEDQKLREEQRQWENAFQQRMEKRDETLNSSLNAMTGLLATLVNRLNSPSPNTYSVSSNSPHLTTMHRPHADMSFSHHSLTGSRQSRARYPSESSSAYPSLSDSSQSGLGYPMVSPLPHPSLPDSRHTSPAYPRELSSTHPSLRDSMPSSSGYPTYLDPSTNRSFTEM